ncbi:MAG: acetyl-CoA C-acetyltransferase [Planctomycetota bacterium]|nr:acetyl-CoA C-acetyltransferase [Planctomycetota bacterium]
MSHSFIVSAVRTPIGSFQGGFKTLTATDLGAAAVEAAVERSGLATGQIDEVIMGNVISAGVGQAPARQAALKAGLPSSVAAVTVNKVCGSGLKAVMFADQAIRCGDAAAIVAGGMENMTAAPHLARVRSGVKLGDSPLQDAMVLDGLTCSFEGCHMGMHAEHTAREFKVTREMQDELALLSQQRAARAMEQGVFDDEIVPVTVKSRRGDTVVSIDEGPRPETTEEGLAGLRTVFDREGTVTAGNASTLSDGAAALTVVNEELAKSADWKFKIVASCTAGTEPRDLFIAPVDAVRGAVQKAGWSLEQVDLYEINEAFASQTVACINELGLDRERVNIYGGGISLGHPIGASGARVLVTLVHALRRTGGQRGVASLCLGGGNAVAMAIESA